MNIIFISIGVLQMILDSRVCPSFNPLPKPKSTSIFFHFPTSKNISEKSHAQLGLDGWFRFFSEEFLENRMCVALGGRLAEETWGFAANSVSTSGAIPLNGSAGVQKGPYA